MLTVYQTDDEGYLIGAVEADHDPLTPGNFLIPRGCVTQQPPATAANQIARWSNGAWEIVPDFRGRAYWLPSGERHEIAERGVPLPVDALDSKPPKSLPAARADKLRELEAARKQAIDNLPPVTVAGKDYPANTEYREVITGIARRKAAGRGRPARLRGKDGAEVVLTDALIDQIDDAITAAVQGAWDRYWARFDAVQAATTVDQVNAVEW